MSDILPAAPFARPSKIDNQCHNDGKGNETEYKYSHDVLLSWNVAIIMQKV